jgi:hypothetical protein
VQCAERPTALTELFGSVGALYEAKGVKIGSHLAYNGAYLSLLHVVADSANSCLAKGIVRLKRTWLLREGALSTTAVLVQPMVRKATDNGTTELSPPLAADCGVILLDQARNGTVYRVAASIGVFKAVDDDDKDQFIVLNRCCVRAVQRKSMSH